MRISKDSVVLKQLRNIKDLDEGFIAESAVRANSAKLVEFNKEQMRMGLDSGGNFFYPYSPSYLAMKLTLPTYHAPEGIPDLYFTGEFQGDMDILTDGDWYSFYSGVPYADNILNRYPRAFGLSKPYMIPAINLITKDYNRFFHTFINK